MDERDLRYLLVMERGINNFVIARYPSESAALAAAPWTCWVLYQEAGGQLVEITVGGLGWATASIRRHVTQMAQFSQVTAGSSAGEEVGWLKVDDHMEEAGQAVRQLDARALTEFSSSPVLVQSTRAASHSSDTQRWWSDV